MISIIGGKYKGSKLQVPLKDVRPTSSIKKEAIFSVLESYALQNKYDLYKGKCCIDLFAGSGSLGLEAISRGASFVYFFEFNQNINEILLINCKKICKNNQFNIHQKDNNTIDQINVDFPVSIIFIDPPYKLNPFDKLLKTILKTNILKDNSIIVIESDKKTSIKLAKEFDIIKEKIYGKTKITFLKKLG